MEIIEELEHTLLYLNIPNSLTVEQVMYYLNANNHINGILPGIFRNLICTNEKVTETKIKLSDLAVFQECFITNSVIGIMRVCSIERYTFGTSLLTNKLQNKYRAFML
jgi:hypothetical protein